MGPVNSLNGPFDDTFSGGPPASSFRFKAMTPMANARKNWKSYVKAAAWSISAEGKGLIY